MCLVLIALDSHPEYRLMVAANRDEFYDRPTAAAAFWGEAPRVLGGRDLRAGGTWLGVDKDGRYAAVTNYRQGEREAAAPRSRGRLVSDYLTGELAPGAYIERVRSEGERYNGFNLLAGDPAELRYFSNREGRARALGPGVYGLSNHLLDTPWPKVAAGKDAIAALLAGAGSGLLTGLLALLSDRRQAADHQLPRTAVSRKWECLLSSAFIASPEYGTRSSTVLLVGHDGRVALIERSFASGGTPAEEGRHEYQLDC